MSVFLYALRGDTRPGYISRGGVGGVALVRFLVRFLARFGLVRLLDRFLELCAIFHWNLCGESDQESDQAPNLARNLSRNLTRAQICRICPGNLRICPGPAQPGPARTSQAPPLHSPAHIAAAEPTSAAFVLFCRLPSNMNRKWHADSIPRCPSS